MVQSSRTSVRAYKMPNLTSISFFCSFMWQICGHIPQTLFMQTDVTCMAAQLSVSFFIETFIHAKEKVYSIFREYNMYSIYLFLLTAIE